MAEFVSGAANLSFAREATYGQRPAVYGGTGGGTQQFMGMLPDGFSPPDASNEVRTYWSIGAGRAPFKQRQARVTRNGSFNLVPNNASIFAFTLGAEAYSAPVHDITVLDAAVLPSFSGGVTLESDSDFKRIFTGMMVDSLDFSCRVGEELRTTANVVSNGVVFDSTTLASVDVTGFDTDGPTRAPFMFTDIKDGVGIQIGGTGYDPTTGLYSSPGTTFTRVEGISGRISNGLHAKYYLRTGDARQPFNYLTSKNEFSAQLDITPAGFESGDEDAVYHLLEREGSIGDVLIPFAKSSSSSTDELDIILEECFIEQAPHNLPDNMGEVNVSVQLKPTNIRIVGRDANAAFLS